VVGAGFLLELRADGSPNAAFGNDGLLIELPTLVGARVLGDGSVEAVGWAPEGSGSNADLAVMRYTAAGKPDSAFGPEGIRRFDLGGREEATVASWAGDGSVIVGGRAQSLGRCPEEGCEEVPLLAAFDPAGDLDPSFGQGGALKLTALAGAPLGHEALGVTALARRPDGSIVAAGGAAPNSSIAFLAAFSPGGALLPGFGEGGTVRVREPVPATQQLVGFAPLPDGGLLAAGTTDVGVENQPVLIRYAADGSLDPSFGDGTGYVLVGSARYAMGFAAAGSGQVLIGLYGYPRSSLVLRSAADGSPMTSFGADGSALLPSHVRVADLTLAADGEATVLGIEAGGAAEPGVLLRYRPDWKPDRHFGHGGQVPLRLPGGGAVTGRALLAGTGGRVIVAGGVGRRFAIVDLLPDGRPDPRFGSGGWATVSADGLAKSATLSRIGSHIYLAGTVNDRGRLRVVLMRFDADGRLDTKFGDRGRFTTPIPRPAPPNAIVPTRRGVVVVLDKGATPLLFFGHDGTVRPRAVPGHSGYATDLRATVSRGQLVLGWNAYSSATRSEVPHLARLPLRGP
jgi:uncharacterized delta-60 repeat protein